MKRIIATWALMTVFLLNASAQFLELDYPRLSQKLDTVFVDFKVMKDGQKINAGYFDKSSLELEEIGYNGDEDISLVDVLDIRGYDQDYANENYSLVVLVDRSVTEEKLKAQRKALMEIFQAFPNAKFYVSAMDASRTPTTHVKNSYQLISWMDSYFSKPSTEAKFIYKAMASLIEECLWTGIQDFYPEIEYNKGLQDETKKAFIILTDGKYMNDKGGYIGGDEFFRIKTALINGLDPNNEIQVNLVYFGDYSSLESFNNEVNYVLRGDDRFFQKYDLTALKEYMVLRPEPKAMDYRMVILNPLRKLYGGQKITLHAYLEKENISAYGKRDFTMGSLLHPLAVNENKSMRINLWVSCIAAGLLFVLLVFFFFKIFFPGIKNIHFKRKHVKTFEKSNVLPSRAEDYVGQKCYYCKDDFVKGDKIITKCEHTMHYDCWKENGYQCPEYGKTCSEGRFFYNEDNVWDKRNTPYYLKSLLVGLLVGIVAWTIFRCFAYKPIFLDTVSKMFMLSDIVGIDVTGAAFADKLHDLFAFCVVVGFCVTFVASWIIERHYKTVYRLLILLLRAIGGAVGGFVAAFIGGQIAMATGKDYNYFVVDIIPWLLLGIVVGFVVSYKTNVSMVKAMLGGFLFALLGFCTLYVFDDRYFSFHNIGIMASVLCMLSVMIFSGGFCAIVSEPSRVSQRYFLQVQGAFKTRDVAIYKWINRTGGYRVATIGRSDCCYIDMDWDDSPGIDGVQAEVYVEDDTPYYKILSTNQTKTLTHGTSFSIGKTVFTYIEKDNI